MRMMAQSLRIRLMASRSSGHRLHGEKMGKMRGKTASGMTGRVDGAARASTVGGRDTTIPTGSVTEATQW